MNNKKLLVTGLLFFAINSNKVKANFLEDIGVEQAAMVATAAPVAVAKPIEPTVQNITLGQNAISAIHDQSNVCINQGVSYYQVSSIAAKYNDRIRQAVLNTTKGGSPSAITTLQSQAIASLKKLLK